MSAKVLIGTSGYSYADWVGPFYPKNLPKKDFLAFYTSQFSLVELNYSYYRQPDEKQTDRMAALTPQEFQFTIKGFGALTHEIGENWREESAIFQNGVRPLVEAGKLLAVLFQFPFSFHYTKKNRLYLADLCESFSSLPTVWEFRNSEWYQEQVIEGMRERNLGMVVPDNPKLKGLPLPSTTVTSSIGYVRYHGRNSASWWSGTNASRYDYLYSDAELTEWLGRISAMSASSRILILVFNNHWRGKAVQNARQLKNLLKLRTYLDVT